MKTYTTKPSEKFAGWYCIVRWNVLKEEYEPIEVEQYPTLEQAEARANELNEAEKEDNENYEKGGKK